MEFYAAVRRSVYVEGLSERAAARRFGLARETVRKMLRYRLPPGYRRAKPISFRVRNWTPSSGVSKECDQILTWRRSAAARRNNGDTAKRTLASAGYASRARLHAGGYTIVKDYVRRQEAEAGKTMFGRRKLAHPAGRRPGRLRAKPCRDVIDGVANARRTTWGRGSAAQRRRRSCRRFRPRRADGVHCEGHNVRVPLLRRRAAWQESTTTPRWRWRSQSNSGA